VDEFQDTDHIQVAMIENLCKEQGKDCFRPGSLFVVGDPKQSIYRFRGAELAVYEDTKEKMSQRDDVVVYELDNNYRSDKSVVTWVNTNFQSCISGYRPMEADKKRNADTEGEKKKLSGVYCWKKVKLSKDD
jgi:ATP-dependent exoDNAse (exonuclease V) beta subunit